MLLFVQLDSKRRFEPAHTPTTRTATGRRVAVARVIAGGPPIRQLARDSGLSYEHLVDVINGRHPLLEDDAQRLGQACNVPARWLLHGFEQQL